MLPHIQQLQKMWWPQRLSPSLVGSCHMMRRGELSGGLELNMTNLGNQGKRQNRYWDRH